MKYIAQTLLWHSVEQRYIRTGEGVDLSHLDRADRARLVESGIVAESRELEFDDMEVTNGSND